MDKIITRKEYMSNSSALFTAYYPQFIPESTGDFICGGGEGRWVWDFTPINLVKAREAGAVFKNALPSPVFHTCVGKVCAKLMLAESK